MPIAQRKIDETQPGAGHNNPPVEETVAMEFRDELLRERPDFLVRFEGIVGAVDRASVTDDETLGKAGDLEKMMRAADAHITETHKVVKEPYLIGGRAADAEKNKLTGRLNDAKARLKSTMNFYMAERDARERAERMAREAEQRRQEAEARAAEALRQEAADANDAEAMVDVPVIAQAAAAPVRAEPVRSDAGATVSGKTVWNAEVTDYAAAFGEVADNPKVRLAVDAAISALVRAGKRELAGCRVWSTIQAIAR